MLRRLKVSPLFWSLYHFFLLKLTDFTLSSDKRISWIGDFWPLCFTLLVCSLGSKEALRSGSCQTFCKDMCNSVTKFHYFNSNKRLPKSCPSHCSKLKMKGKKTKLVPILLPRASRNFPNVKTGNEKKIHNWTSEIIPFIWFGKQMDGT